MAITNHPIFVDDKPVLWPDVERPPVESQIVYATETQWTYTHHPHIGLFDGRLWAMWSNGRVNEDRAGQRVMVSSSADFRHWAEPQVIAEPGLMPDGSERVLTAAGFHAHDGMPSVGARSSARFPSTDTATASRAGARSHNDTATASRAEARSHDDASTAPHAGTLVAYFGDYGPHKEDTRLWAVTTEDGENWSEWLDMGIPVCPNFGPQATRSGRLIIAGNISFPYTDDPSGLTGWTMAGIYPPDMEGVTDDPDSFWVIAENAGWPTAVCEGSLLQTDDGVLHMLLRAETRGFRWRLWQTDSYDDGMTWTPAVETDFTDCNAKIHLGRLPDGRCYCAGNPVAGNRWPLVLALSEDGVSFDRHLILGEGRWPLPEDAHRPGEYGYPHTLVHEGYLYVLVSRQKQAIEVLRVRLDDL